jgi:hypothetical protein
MDITAISFYETLKTKFSEAEAKTIVEGIRSEIESQLEKKDVATKKDILELKVELIRWLFGFWVTLVLLILANWFLRN